MIDSRVPTALMAVSANGIVGARHFPQTSWSALVAARDPGSPDYTRRLQALVELYWKPVYTVIRHGWSRTSTDAQDLTQEFFLHAVFEGNLLRTFEPERGSFRTFLRQAINFFMCETVRDATRLKRGGGLKFASLDVADAEGEAPESSSPEEIFDASWNRLVLARAFQLSKERLEAEGKALAFELFERYDLDSGREAMSYTDLGRPHGLSAAQVKHALIHARALFRDAVIEVVREYVVGPGDLARELELLIGR